MLAQFVELEVGRVAGVAVFAGVFVLPAWQCSRLRMGSEAWRSSEECKPLDLYCRQLVCCFGGNLAWTCSFLRAVQNDAHFPGDYISFAEQPREYFVAQ